MKYYNLEKAREAGRQRIPCQHCETPTARIQLKRHETRCYLNPANLKFCLGCQAPLKDIERTFCSHKCSNSTQKRPRKDADVSYRVVCFRYHDKKCVVCGEEVIVAVHHVDEDHENNSPENLVPLCPTHHQYVHSGFRHLVEDKINTYLLEWSGREDLNLQPPRSKRGTLRA